MTKRSWMVLALVLTTLALLVGCGQSGGTGGGVPEDAAFEITGQVDQEVGWTEDELRAMDTTEAQSTNKEGETSTHTGVAINTLLDIAGVQDGATTLVLVGDDGYTAEVALSEVQACNDCLIAFGDEGSLGAVLPGFPGNVQVKGIVEIQVQ